MADSLARSRPEGLTREEVARRLGVGRTTIRRMQERGELRPTRGVDGIWYIALTEVEALEAKRPSQGGVVGRQRRVPGAAGQVVGYSGLTAAPPRGQPADDPASRPAAGAFDAGTSDPNGTKGAGHLADREVGRDHERQRLANLEGQVAALAASLDGALAELAAQARQLAEQKVMQRLTVEGLGGRVAGLEHRLPVVQGR